MIQEMKLNTYTTQPMKGNFEPCPQCESPVEEVSGVVAEIEDRTMHPRLVDRYNQLTGFTLIPCGCYLDSYAYTLVIMPELPGQWIASQQLEKVDSAITHTPHDLRHHAGCVISSPT